MEHKVKRKDVFAELFQRINLRKLLSFYLENTVLNEMLVKENCVCLNLVTETLAMKIGKHVSNYATTVLNLGGEDNRNKVFTVYRDDGNVYSALPQAVDAHCSLELDGFVYCRMGWRVISSSDEV